MIRWIAKLSNGDIAEQDKESWVEIPGERLPWPRLCSYLSDNNLYIENLSVVTPNGVIDIAHVLDLEKMPLFFGVQYRLEVNDILGNSPPIYFLHVTTHTEDKVYHVLFNNETGEYSIETTDEYDPMMPSPRRII